LSFYFEFNKQKPLDDLKIEAPLYKFENIIVISSCSKLIRWKFLILQLRLLLTIPADAEVAILSDFAVEDIYGRYGSERYRYIKVKVCQLPNICLKIKHWPNTTTGNTARFKKCLASDASLA
jgi:hypothetical protein